MAKRPPARDDSPEVTAEFFARAKRGLAHLPASLRAAIEGSRRGRAARPLEGPVPFRWSRERYDRLVESGVIDDTHIELIDGELLEIEGISSPRHATGIVRATEALRRAFPHRLIRAQLPLVVTDRDEPEPDVALVAGTVDDYRESHPTTAELVVEVSDTALRYDQTSKAALYARAGIATYWLIDVVHDCVEVRTAPTALGYGHVTRRHRGETLLPGLAVDDVVPRR